MQTFEMDKRLSKNRKNFLPSLVIECGFIFFQLFHLPKKPASKVTCCSLGGLSTGLVA
jgi:hypothetical protein